MKKSKLLAYLLTSILIIGCCSSFVGCGEKKSSGIDVGEFSYYEENLTKKSDYNTELFYLNSLEFQVADPTVIFVTEGAEKGYFYAYGTSDDLHCHGFQSWRSKDLTHWESMGVAFKPDFASTWATTNYWAPEVIYDDAERVYYMFYNAENLNTDKKQYMSVAYSENPQGPFVVADGRKNADGVMLRSNKPAFDFTRANESVPATKVRAQTIDASPFIDPVSGDKYLYFSYFDAFTKSEIFGVKMKDWFTPDYSTLTQITAVGYLTVEAGINQDVSKKTAEGTINEGPFMYYDNGTYYMTLSVYGFTDEKYQVRQALSSSPLGIFTKESVANGGTVISTNGIWDHLTSAGHHSFVKCGDELFIAYHTFLNRNDISGGRALAVDRVEFISSGDKKLMHTNGPTYSLQALPELISGYKDIALSASVTSSNTAEDSDVKYLNDGIVKYQDIDLATEYDANAGKTVLTYKWDEFKTARAIMIYNSYDYYKTFVRIEKIAITYKLGDGKTATTDINKLGFDWEWNANSSSEIMRPGGAVIAEFNDLPINQIQITIKSSDENIGFSISEIVVLGKEEAVSGITKFQQYNYSNPEFASPELVNKSKNFGAVDGLKTGYGYDLSHDDGTENAYIEQNWCYDQYARFNNVYDTKFYIEAKISVTEATAYANDAFPKFGISISCPQNTIFFYVDAVGFSRQTVGCAQRKLDNSDWNWNATEQLVDVAGLKYTNDNYVKLAVIRDGVNFYMLVNDKLVISYDKFVVFIDTTKSAVGFLTFNTGVKIKDYTATNDAKIVADKIAEL